ncbi:MAG: hypothetical protein HYW05_02470 [Candidatus Diapherotrites archaeon]|nr:hypothetical protein [Candidatus Diapherotrites archaeon]
MGAFEIAILAIAVFLITAICEALWIKFAKARGLVGLDWAKKGRVLLSEGGGIAMLPAIWFAIAFLFFGSGNFNYIAWGLLLSAFAAIGIIDDTKHKFLKKALSWRKRAVAIAVVCLAFSGIYFWNFGVLWIVLAALYIAGIASFQNTFAGLNGWQGGSAAIIVAASALMVAKEGPGGVWLNAVLIAAILGFLAWNKYPAKVFEGNSGTLIIGSAIAGIFILNGKIGLMAFSLLFFLPHMFEFVVLKLILSKARDPGQMRQLPYRVLENGKIAIPEYAKGKVQYDFAKMLIRIFGPMREWELVAIIWAIVALNAAFWLLLFGLV